MAMAIQLIILVIALKIENVKTATITKGADSLKSGSGALGGSVIFETKDARDYLIDKDYYLSYVSVAIKQ